MMMFPTHKLQETTSTFFFLESVVNSFYALCSSVRAKVKMKQIIVNNKQKHSSNDDERASTRWHHHHIKLVSRSCERASNCWFSKRETAQQQCCSEVGVKWKLILNHFYRYTEICIIMIGIILIYLRWVCVCVSGTSLIPFLSLYLACMCTHDLAGCLTFNLISSSPTCLINTLMLFFDTLTLEYRLAT